MRKFSISKKSALLLAAGIAIIGVSSVGTTNALPSISGSANEIVLETKSVDIEVGDITGLDTISEEFFVDRAYDVNVSIQNAGMDSYIRATVTKYWVGEDGKRVDLDPSLIEIKAGSSWKEDAASTTAEKSTYYYQGVVASGAGLDDLIDTVTLNKALATKIEAGEGVPVYAYDDLTLVIEVKADAIQTHNAADAVQSVWGVDAGVAGVTE